MGLLGCVDQQKEECERTRGHGALHHAQAVDSAEDVLERRRIALAVTPAAGCDTELLDNLERFLSLESLDHSAECAGEPTDILVERKVLGSSL